MTSIYSRWWRTNILLGSKTSIVGTKLECKFDPNSHKRAQQGTKTMVCFEGYSMAAANCSASNSAINSGICFDKIVEKAATLREVGVFHQLVTVLALTLRLDCPLYPTGISNAEALWRTIIADTYCSTPAGPETREAFYSFLVFCLWRLEDAALGTQNFDSKGTGFRPDDSSFFDHIEIQNIHTATYVALNDLASSDPSGNIPDSSALAAALDVLKGPPSAMQDNTIAGCNQYIGSMSKAYGARRLFCTAEKFLGIASNSLLPNDEVWIVAGAAAPLSLRPAQQDKFTLIGEAYVRGVMFGEAVSTTKAQMTKSVVIE